ncbi:hypothetical protein C1752_03698 [Acaryochloris thomasi RCC1774]|uniref:Uncharacterized protein n=1 Tax=Acaryochloris thomasi RCC1774 TaxID=1764569 RepID=A0A2W1JGK2_9CYAN|nr:hypothetical protein [Acaryochloris thomasi]PZD72536.1 hypothetical protein C1752_03698 [Acaryochloris thomasi RCC1774]
MTQPILPDSKKIDKTVSALKKVCHQFDELNITLDELIAQVDIEIQKNPLTAYRSEKDLSVEQT